VNSSQNDATHPLITLAVTGRNDGYGVRYRLIDTLRFNHRELTARGISYEYVLTEWAPDPQWPLLADLIAEALPETHGLVTSYVVDPAYHQALTLNPRLPYMDYLAKNVAIRRARGRFILATNVDIYLGREALDALASKAIEPRTVYRAVRRDLKLGAEYVNPAWDVLEDPRNLESPPRPLKMPLMLGGSGDFALLDRDTFHELQGFNEVYRLARVGVDANFLVKAYSSGLPFADIGGPVYHINHVGSYRLSQGAFAGREASAPWGDRRWRYHGVVYDNPPTWGLRDAPVRDLGGGRWRLDFAWTAVPPLVDLRRIVLPVDRVGRLQPRRYKK
jgi:hypothetical protein